jgi:nucleoside-diphosphate-sugar epimerase
MDSSKIAKLGWKPEISIMDGISEFYKFYNLPE